MDAHGNTTYLMDLIALLTGQSCITSHIDVMRHASTLYYFWFVEAFLYLSMYTDLRADFKSPLIAFSEAQNDFNVEL